MARANAYLSAIMIWLKLTPPLVALIGAIALVFMTGSSSLFA